MTVATDNPRIDRILDLLSRVTQVDPIVTTAGGVPFCFWCDARTPSAHLKSCLWREAKGVLAKLEIVGVGTTVDERSMAGVVLVSFVNYCNDHPEERFWQALRNWSGYKFVWVGEFFDRWDSQDTFSWEGRRDDKE